MATLKKVVQGDASMIDRLDASLRFQQEALSLRNQRHSVIASNIAHADTPGYKARDFDFASTLAQSVERGHRNEGMSLSTTRRSTWPTASRCNPASTATPLKWMPSAWPSPTTRCISSRA